MPRSVCVMLVALLTAGSFRNLGTARLESSAQFQPYEDTQRHNFTHFLKSRSATVKLHKLPVMYGGDNLVQCLWGCQAGDNTTFNRLATKNYLFNFSVTFKRKFLFHSQTVGTNPSFPAGNVGGARWLLSAYEKRKSSLKKSEMRGFDW